MCIWSPGEAGALSRRTCSHYLCPVLSLLLLLLYTYCAAADGSATARIVNPALQTEPQKNNLYSRPVCIIDPEATGATPIAE